MTEGCTRCAIRSYLCCALDFGQTFIMEIDAIDNGISQSDGVQRYQCVLSALLLSSQPSVKT